jgi:hypothetical protein
VATQDAYNHEGEKKDEIGDQNAHSRLQKPMTAVGRTDGCRMLKLRRSHNNGKTLNRLLPSQILSFASFHLRGQHAIPRYV